MKGDPNPLLVENFLSNLDPFIHEPVRLGVLMLLHFNSSLAFSTIQRGLGVTSGNLNSHLKKLAEEGYVNVEKAFVDLRPRTLVQITDAGRSALRTYSISLKKILISFDDED
ncbi:MAG: transcriptional regulator [Candidatus Hodarchaeales archaeon]|jgi:DNA-binding MarR family transcriptional regulator